MKNKYFSIILLVALLITSMNLVSQTLCDPTKVIDTDPDAPVNSEVPSKANGNGNGSSGNPFYGAIFDWRLNTGIQGVNAYKVHSSTLGNALFVNSPFFDPDNTFTDLFVQQRNQQHHTDFRPSDGWELIRQEFGYYDNGAEKLSPCSYPYVILYNKYQSVLRVFVNIGQQNANTLSLQLTFSNDHNSRQTSLIDVGMASNDETINALDDFRAITGLVSLQSVKTFTSQGNHWYYADFPIMYDPCTCYVNSIVNIFASLTTVVHVEATGTTTGTIVDKASSGSGAESTPTGESQSSWSYSALSTTVNEVGKKAAQAYSDANGFYTATTKRIEDNIKTDTQPWVALSSNGGYVIMPTHPLKTQEDAKKSLGILDGWVSDASPGLKDLLKATPFISAGLSIFDYFLSGGHQAPATQKVSISPMVVNLNTEIKGSLTSNFVMLNIDFRTPGSLFDVSSLPDDTYYPYYNMPLGVFNLWSTPVFEYKIENNSISSITDDGYDDAERPQYLYSCDTRLSMLVHVPENIKYVLNPAAKLSTDDPELDVSVAVIYKFDSKVIGSLVFASPSMWSWVDDYTCQTALIPAGCLQSVDLSYYIPYTPKREFVARSYWTYYGSDFCDPGALVFDQDDNIVGYPQDVATLKAPKASMMVVGNFARTDADANTQRVLTHIKYPIKLNESTNDDQYFHEGLSYQDVASDLYLNQNTRVNGLSTSESVWRNVYMSSGLIINNTSAIDVTAVLGIEVDDDIEINSDVVLELRTPLQCSNVIRPYDVTNSDCLSTQYNVNRSSHKEAVTQQDGVKGESAIRVVEVARVNPNPATDLVNVEFSSNVTGSFSAQVFDSYGRSALEDPVTRSYSRGGSLVTLRTTSLESGAYNVVVKTSNGSYIRLPFVIVR